MVEKLISDIDSEDWQALGAVVKKEVLINHSALYVFGLWVAIALCSGLAALSGYTVLADVLVSVQAATTALAAGAILSMIVETMIPEAFEGTHGWAGIITCTGFFCAFVISMLGG